MRTYLPLLLASALLAGIQPGHCAAPAPDSAGNTTRYLIEDDFLADPAARVIGGKLWVYTSHDRRSEVDDPTDGAHYDMRDYCVLSLDPRGGAIERHDAVLTLDDVPWASRQLWACDALQRGDSCYLFFPARDRQGDFRIGVAVADRPEGPFAAAPEPIPGTYSIDPALFEEQGAVYIYFGGLQGGQLQCYRDNIRLEQPRFAQPAEAALPPRVARLSDDLRSLAEAPRPVVILDERGEPLRADDPHRFFEGAWIHKYKGVYYFSYSTGSSHLICYATGDNPYGPFTYRGVILTPVVGWTTHHSIVEYGGRWWLFHHDSAPSGGVSSLRSVKVCELEYESDGSIRTIAGGRP